MRADFAHRYGPWAVIAGGSEGIGAAYADQLAAQGINLVLIARRADALEATAQQIRAGHGVEVRTASVDLTDTDVMAKVEELTDGLDVGLLIYNAGAMHGAQLFIDKPIEDSLKLVEMNCRTVALFAHHFGRRLSARGRGGIVLMTSMSAAVGSPYTAVYNATKAFDLVLAEGLWMELGSVGVDVVAVPAGLTATPSMEKSGILDRPGMPPMDAAAVATDVLDALGTAGPMIVPGESNRAVAAGMWPVDRGMLVGAMAQSVAVLYEVPLLSAPDYA